MASYKLPQLSTVASQKRLLLSQGEIAYLLGNENAAKVSRHESFLHEPAFRAALAYEAIFRKSGRELFAGIYDRIGRAIASRAAILLERLESSKPTRRNARKQEALRAIISSYGDK